MPTSTKPSQGERRRAREHARQFGVRYADALRAIRNGAEAEPQTRYLYVPFPLPRLDFDNDDAPCPHCDGTGVSGLGGGHDARGDCLAVIERLREMAASALSSSTCEHESLIAPKEGVR